MIEFDIAYSLNKSATIQAENWEEAERKLKEQIEAEGVALHDEETDENPEGYTLELFDVNEECVECEEEQE